MLPSRESIRLPGYHYSQPGAYFVTVCCHARQMLFGSVRDGEMRKSALGFMAAEHLFKLPRHYGNVKLDASIIMPNHVHFVVFILKPQPMAEFPPASSLSSIVGGYKSAVSREAGKLKLNSGRIWMPRFHDHEIRHEKALDRIREYILNNPRQWSLDRENPDRSSENEFYAWLDGYTKRVQTLLKEGPN